MEARVRQRLQRTAAVTYNDVRDALRWYSRNGNVKALGGNSYLVTNHNQVPREQEDPTALAEEPGRPRTLPPVLEWAEDREGSGSCSSIVLYLEGLPLMEFFANNKVIIYGCGGFWSQAAANRINLFTKGHHIEAHGARSRSGSSRITYRDRISYTPQDLTDNGALGLIYTIGMDGRHNLEYFQGSPPDAIFPNNSYESDFSALTHTWGRRAGRPESASVWLDRMRTSWAEYRQRCIDNGISITYSEPWLFTNGAGELRTAHQPYRRRHDDRRTFDRIRNYVSRMIASIVEEGGLYRNSLPRHTGVSSTRRRVRALSHLLNTNIFPRQIYVHSATYYRPESVVPVIRNMDSVRGFAPQQRRPGVSNDPRGMELTDEQRVALAHSLERGLCSMMLINHPDFPDDGQPGEGEGSGEEWNLQDLDSFRVESLTPDSAVITFAV